MTALVSTVLWTVLMTMILTILSNLTISVDRTLSTFGISKQTTIPTAKHRTAPVRFSQFIYSFKAMNLLLSQMFVLSSLLCFHCFAEIQDGNNIQVEFSASYKVFFCHSSTMYSETKTKIPETVQHGLKNLNCIASGTCSLDKASVTGCNQRSKRSTTSSSAGFQLSLSCDPNICKLHTETFYNNKILLIIAFD